MLTRRTFSNCTDTGSCVYRKKSILYFSLQKKFFFRDSKILVCAGRSNLLHVYSLESYKLTQVIKMPKEVLSIKQIQFLSDKFDARASKVGAMITKFI